MSASGFYHDLPPVSRFGDAARPDFYRRLPDDWVVAVTDVVGSTKAIHDGRYKAVNMAGAAAISALMNVSGGEEFPFVFGGDGSAAALPVSLAEDAAAALMATRVWVEEELGLRLRVGVVAIEDIRKAGRDVLVARFRVSPDVSYAMFAGGGVSWAEAMLKSGRLGLPPAAPGSRPDLSGLSCRWAPIGSRSGVILSVLAVPSDSAPADAFATTVADILDLLSTSPRNGHPVPPDGPDFRWPAQGADMEVSARAAMEGRFSARWSIWVETLVGLVLDRAGLRLGGFDMRRYRRVLSRNSDFRKFEDGLRLTVDVEPELGERIERVLAAAEADGILHYGLATQDAALLTCIVPSYTADDHMHFVDGAGGGYAAAAMRLKLKQSKATGTAVAS